MRSWMRFCKEYGIKPILNFGEGSDVERETKKLTNFLHFEMMRTNTLGKRKIKSASTFVCYLYDIKRYHNLRGRSWKPTKILKLKLASIKRQYKAGNNRKWPLLASMVTKMEKENALNTRDKDDELIVIVMMLTVYGMFRISEILHEPKFYFEMVRGVRQVIVKLDDYKTLARNDGLPQWVAVAELKQSKEERWCPVSLMWNRYKKKLNKKQKLKTRLTDGTRLSRDTYSEKLKLCLRSIGINASKYDTHSGRIGGATMLWELGYSEAQIMKLGRWKSDSWKVYCRVNKGDFTKATRSIQTSRLVEKDITFD